MRSLSHPLLALITLLPCAKGAITVSSSSLEWTPLVGNFDTLGDQGTGQSSADIVGAGINYGMLIGFNDNGSGSSTDGDLFFRLRFDAAGQNEIFNDVVFIGIDADVNGSIDAFLAMNPKTNPNQLAIYLPGPDLNTSPSTTSVGAPTLIANTDSTNYNYRPVDWTTDGGDTNDLTPNAPKDKDDPDYYVSFMVPFQSVVNFLGGVGITVTDQSPMRYISATSTQDNALNQDLGGIDDDNYVPSDPWNFSTPVTLVPEPSSSFLALGSLGAALLIRRRRSQ